MRILIDNDQVGKRLHLLPEHWTPPEERLLPSPDPTLIEIARWKRPRMQSSGPSQIALIVFADNEVESLRCSVIIVMYLSNS